MKFNIMFKLCICLALTMLVSCTSSVTTTVIGADGKPQRVEMSEDAYIETQRINANSLIVDKQVSMIDKGQTDRNNRMSKPLVTLKFTSMNCDKMTDGNCLFEVSQPITTEMLEVDSKATTLQLAQIKTINAPSNASDVLIAGFSAFEGIGVKALDVIGNNATTIGFVALGKAGIDAATELGTVIAATPSSVDNSINTDSNDSTVTTTAGNDLISGGSSKDASVSNTSTSNLVEDISGTKIVAEGDVKLNSDNPTVTEDNSSEVSTIDSNDNIRGDTSTEIAQPAAPVVVD